MRDSLQAAHTQVWGAVFDDTRELAAFAVLSVVLDEVELLTISVAKKHQSNGYGDQLMAFLLDKSRHANADTLYLEVNANNLGAISFYEKHGFIETGIRKAYYSVPGGGVKDDAVLMSLDLA